MKYLKFKEIWEKAGYEKNFSGMMSGNIESGMRDYFVSLLVALKASGEGKNEEAIKEALEITEKLEREMMNALDRIAFDFFVQNQS